MTKQRREHCGRNAHHVVAHGAEPVEIREHLLRLPHHRFEPLGNVEHLQAAALFGEPPRDLLDDLVTRIGNRINRVPKADHHLSRLDAPANVRLGFLGAVIPLLNVQRDLVRASMLRSTQCADGSRNARKNIRARTRNHAPPQR